MDDKHLKQLWQQQPAAAAAFGEAELQRIDARLRRAVRRRNSIETGAGLLVMAIFAWYAWLFPQPLLRFGSLAIAAAALFVTRQLLRRASSRDQAVTALPWREHHRAQLVRQRDALRSAWLWYVAPFVPGLLLFRWGVGQSMAAGFVHGAGANLLVAAVLLAVAAANRHAARRLQARIDALDALA